MKKNLAFITMGLISMGMLTLFGCNTQNKVQVGDTVEITYTAALPDGSIFKKNEKGETLRFIVGAGEVIKGLDEGVIGSKVGKSRKITVKAEDGYGSEFNPLKIQKLSKKTFEDLNIPVEKGSKQTLGDIEGVIWGTETDDKGNEFVLLNINAPYTYQNLTYTIQIISLQKAATQQ